MKLLELLEIGSIHKLNRDDEIKPNEKVFYQLGEWAYYIGDPMTRVSEFTYDKYKGDHRLKQWQVEDKFKEVDLSFWEQYSNDDDVSDEEIEHHNFIKVKLKK